VRWTAGIAWTPLRSALWPLMVLTGLFSCWAKRKA
jgi:hypothetical protein